MQQHTMQQHTMRQELLQSHQPQPKSLSNYHPRKLTSTHCVNVSAMCAADLCYNWIPHSRVRLCLVNPGRRCKGWMAGLCESQAGAQGTMFKGLYRRGQRQDRLCRLINVRQHKCQVLCNATSETIAVDVGCYLNQSQTVQ